MNPIKSLLAAAIALSSCAASAQFVTGSTGGLGNGSSLLTLNTSSFKGGWILEDWQGSVLDARRPVNIDNGTTTLSTSGYWAAVGNSLGDSCATLLLAPGTTAVSLLWGSPDPSNVLKINTTKGSQTFTAGQFFKDEQISKSDVAGYVKFQVTDPNATILSIEVHNDSMGAFEIANVRAVPEPGTYAMLLGGLAAVGFVARRRGRPVGSAVTEPAGR